MGIKPEALKSAVAEKFHQARATGIGNPRIIENAPIYESPDKDPVFEAATHAPIGTVTLATREVPDITYPHQFGYTPVEEYQPEDPTERMWEHFASDDTHHLSSLANALRRVQEADGGKKTVRWRAPIPEVLERTGMEETQLQQKANIMHGVLAIDGERNEIYLTPANPR